ncbi:MAG TPA: GntR family transcriptional regulator [Jiangellaceae bacterium]|nr:GntR family transcriptional regulator [Jiangellaceae bacterium]
MLVRLDPNSAEPLFAQLAAGVRAAVAQGDVVAGERLPGARDLADSLGVNVHTVLRGYQQLRDEGLVELRRGRGAVVTEQAARGHAALRQALVELGHQGRRLGLSTDELIALVKEIYR